MSQLEQKDTPSLKWDSGYISRAVIPNKIGDSDQVRASKLYNTPRTHCNGIKKDVFTVPKVGRKFGIVTERGNNWNRKCPDGKGCARSRNGTAGLESEMKRALKWADFVSGIF